MRSHDSRYDGKRDMMRLDPLTLGEGGAFLRALRQVRCRDHPAACRPSQDRGFSAELAKSQWRSPTSPSRVL
jgi:hypothetical protein